MTYRIGLKVLILLILKGVILHILVPYRIKTIQQAGNNRKVANMNSLLLYKFPFSNVLFKRTSLSLKNSSGYLETIYIESVTWKGNLFLLEVNCKFFTHDTHSDF